MRPAPARWLCLLVLLFAEHAAADAELDAAPLTASNVNAVLVVQR